MTSRRAAWVIVIIMSTVFVLALLGVIWGFVRQPHTSLRARTAANASASSSMSATMPAAAAIMLAPGARIVSVTTDAGKLVLHVDTPTGGEVEIVDLATGKLTGQVRTTPAVPSR